MKLRDYEMLDALTAGDYVRAIRILAEELAVYPGEAAALLAEAKRGEFLFSRQGTHVNAGVPARQLLVRVDHVNYIWIQGLGFRRSGTLNARSITMIFEPERYEAT